ncbi:MAG: beta-galactosidase [Thermoproteota archaeon]
MSILGFDEKSLKINDRGFFVYSGELHYFRILRELWEDRLIKVKRAFLNSVSIYFAWNWHEYKEGVFDFSGWRDIDEFLSLCEKHGLYVIARPGPYICSEWDFGGLPGWLIGKECIPRSLDNCFMKYALHYYDHVIPVLRRHLITRGGSIILFQIENEYFWGNVPYLLKLYDAARERGIDVPIVHNMDRFLRGTQVIDSIDIYPSPWDIKGPESQARSLIEEQPDKPPMLMEFEGGWFSSFGGSLPTDKGDIPAEWTDMLLKHMIFMGFTLVNFYMTHGGTNFGYWTGKNITSTYDYQAAIREWGELGDRYWAIRLVGALLDSFNELFASSAVDEGLVKCDHPYVYVSAKTGGGGSFILVENRDVNEASPRLFIKGLGEREIRIKRRTAVILPCNLRLPNGWILEFSTAQVFYSYDLNGRTILLLYGDVGEDHEVTLIRPFSRVRDTVRLRVTEDDSINLIKDKYSSLLLIVLSRHRASRTWFAEYLGKRIAVISGFDLLRSYSSKDGCLKMHFDLREGSDRRVKIITPWRMRGLIVEDKSIEGKYEDKKWVFSFTMPETYFEGVEVSLDEEWRVAFEGPEHVKSQEFVKMNKITPPESLGMAGNGHFWYFNTFSFRKDGNMGKVIVLVPRVNDYVSVFINGVFIGYAKHSGRFEVDQEVFKEGLNEIVLLVESTGHRNDGILPIPNGLNEPVFIDREEVIKLEKPSVKFLDNERFFKPGISSFFNYALFVNRPLKIIPRNFFDEGWIELHGAEEIADKTGTVAFKYLVEIPESRKKACLILPRNIRGWGRIMVIVNRQHAGTIPVDEESGLNVTGLLKPGEINELVFILENMPSIPVWNDPCLRLYDMALEEGWKISQGLLGEKECWYDPCFNDSKWSCLSDVALDREGVIWLRKRFSYRSNSNVISPVRLKIRSLGIKCKIYLNGFNIGRWMKIGPQTDFYMPETFLKEENVLAIAVENYGEKFEKPSIEILPYYSAKKISIEVYFT